MFKGFGDMKEFVAEWDSLMSQTEDATVIQQESMSGIASMSIREGIWEIELGQ